MRGSIKIKDSWQNITLTEDPALLSDWLWAHDGRDAVCIDDKKQIYYCATHELRDKYQKGGKKAAMFWDLEQKLRESMLRKNGKQLEDAVKAPSPTRCWCQRHMIACSEGEVCGEDCGGVVNTFGLEEEGDEETDGVAALEDTPVLAAV